jgi:hypothetical protein
MLRAADTTADGVVLCAFNDGGTSRRINLEGQLPEVCNCRVLCPCWIGEDPDHKSCDNHRRFAAHAETTLRASGTPVSAAASRDTSQSPI